MRNQTLRELYLDQLRVLYSAEQQLTAALPQMARSATAPELKQGFEKHLTQTNEHVRRLEQLFAALGQSPAGKVSFAMQGLIQEGNEAAGENEASGVRDAALLTAAQRVEHYEIAAYGTVISYAQLLGDGGAAEILGSTLQEESQTDSQLTALARTVNSAALSN